MQPSQDELLVKARTGGRLSNEHHGGDATLSKPSIATGKQFRNFVPAFPSVTITYPHSNLYANCITGTQRGVRRIFDRHANLRLDIHVLRREVVNGWVMILSAVMQNNSMWTEKKHGTG
jgi:hypothetical protein